jgi:signal transduction histidine kinase/DNA-binding response OmpR family regulator
LSQLNNEIVVRFFQDSKGYWWIGTHKGIYLYNDKTNRLTRIQLKSGDRLISSTLNRVIAQIDTNRILIGGTRVSILKDPWKYILKNEAIPVENNMPNYDEIISVNDFFQDDFGNFWFATRNGILRLKNENGQFQIKNHITTRAGEDSLMLSHNNVFSIFENENQDIWLGTFGGGLMKIKLNQAGVPESIKSYRKEDGLPDEAVYGMLEDDDGKFWISTDMGICHFDPVTEKFEVYDVNDGILNNNFRQSAYLKTTSGLMLMGGLNGLTVFDPKKIKKNEIPPKVLLTQLKINDQPVVAGKNLEKKLFLENSIADTKELVLGYRYRNISLDIIVQHNSTPQKNKLSYMLEGVNQDWVKVDGGKTTATYTNLSPGSYRFLYKGANGDGIWTENASALIIHVLTPWYLRWWCLSIWAGMLLLIVYGIFRYLVRLEKLKQKLKFEQLDKERIHELDQAKLRFFTNISHEFKTPLSLIMGPLEKIEERNCDKGNNKYFSIIQNNISRLQRLVEQLISYRKAETGHLKPEYTKTTLGNFIYPLLEAFEESAKRTNINFYHKINVPNRQVIVDVDKTERILLNLFSNAIKFTEQNGEISFEAGFKETVEVGEQLYFKISDTGIGISPDKIDKIFDRFYRAVDDRGNWGGTGIGLALCKALIDLLMGKISVESIPGKKTTFEINLPFQEVLNVEVEEDTNKQREIAIDWIVSEPEEIQNETENLKLPSLLIIDDETDVRSFLYEAFKSKYKITLAVDGEDGLSKIAESKPQLIISDVMMPKLDGYQLCEKIKSNPETCHIPVILLTALDQDSKKIEGLELGADDYISKPFSIRHLEVRTKTLIENKQRIIEYFSKHATVHFEELNMSNRDQSFLKNVITAIEKNMSNSWFGVEELAGEAKMSTSYFYRRLKQLTGQVPNVYLRNYRLQKAAELLKANPQLNANEVMYEIGIESPSYFSTSFKKVHGVTPSEFIKMNKC